ncbi:MAG TPA: hypothetical protein VKD67_05020, partial [Acidimicrobiales bacterium]|nr:hypothetical protein [Acidimicrobiales bacterium]
MWRGGVASLIVLATATVSPAGAADWPRYGGNDQLTNDVAAADSAGISSASAGGLIQRWTAKLDGKIYASPLYAEGVETTDGRENLAFAFTEAGSVFALRARDGSVVWQR